MTNGVNDRLMQRRMGLQKYMQDSGFRCNRRVTPFISLLTALSAALAPNMSVILFPIIPHWSGKNMIQSKDTILKYDFSCSSSMILLNCKLLKT